MKKYIIIDNTTGLYFKEIIPFIGSPLFSKKDEAETFSSHADADKKISQIGETRTCSAIEL